MRDVFKVGDIVQHFKRETIIEHKGRTYLYIIIGISKHTETGELFVIYKPLYEPTSNFLNVDYLARPLDDFMSEVDHEKYPNITQKYRFELYPEI